MKNWASHFLQTKMKFVFFWNEICFNVDPETQKKSEHHRILFPPRFRFSGKKKFGLFFRNDWSGNSKIFVATQVSVSVSANVVVFFRRCKKCKKQMSCLVAWDLFLKRNVLFWLPCSIIQVQLHLHVKSLGSPTLQPTLRLRYNMINHFTYSSPKRSQSSHFWQKKSFMEWIKILSMWK